MYVSVEGYELSEGTVLTWISAMRMRRDSSKMMTSFSAAVRPLSSGSSLAPSSSAILDTLY